MNKRLNTILFILGATIFNILITVLFFLILLIIYVRFLLQILPEPAHKWAFPLLFIGAIVISFLIYRYSIRFLIKKIDMEKYFDPLFVRRQRKQ